MRGGYLLLHTNSFCNQVTGRKSRSVLSLQIVFHSAMFCKGTLTPREARESERHAKMLEIWEWVFSSEKRKQVFSDKKPKFWMFVEIVRKLQASPI